MIKNCVGGRGTRGSQSPEALFLCKAFLVILFTYLVQQRWKHRGQLSPAKGGEKMECSRLQAAYMIYKKFSPPLSKYLEECSSQHLERHPSSGQESPIQLTSQNTYLLSRRLISSGEEKHTPPRLLGLGIPPLQPADGNL
jgi:hypothetical protein